MQADKKKNSNETLPQMILITTRKVIKQPNRFVHTSSLNLIFALKTTKEPRLRLDCSLCLWHYATSITPHIPLCLDLPLYNLNI